MNQEQRAIIRGLVNVRAVPNGYDHRFIRALDWMRRHEPQQSLSPRQRYQLHLLAYRYRRQLAGSLDEALIPTTAPAESDYVREKPDLQVDLLDGSARAVTFDEPISVADWEREQKQRGLL